MTRFESVHTRMFRNAGPQEKIPVGISACLLGKQVRFDGGHKRSAFCTNMLSQYFEFVPYCPEVAIGMGTPRDPVRLVWEGEEKRMVGTKDPDRDFTEPMKAWAEQQAGQLEGLSGFIFMQKSPTCGVFRTKVYEKNRHPNGAGSGLWAEAVMTENPLLPVEEAGRLNDPHLLENFLTRVFTLHEWKRSLGDQPTAGRLVDFHSRHKLLIMAHDPAALQAMGRLVASLNQNNAEQVSREYLNQLMKALGRTATRRRHTHVLQYINRFLRRFVPRAALEELHAVREQYAHGDVPLVVPITLLKHYVGMMPEGHYLSNQVYLQPHPCNLGLRNAI
ncbi:DUF523 and DUF1722 domain-containing protein [Marinobacteraceae bacterium S3BR75-40.1]